MLASDRAFSYPSQHLVSSAVILVRRVISRAPTLARLRCALRAATVGFIRGGGGILTEFQKQKLPRLFALHDLNRDGVINRADFEDYARMIAATRGWGTHSPEYNELFGRFLTFWNGLEQVAKSRGTRHVTLNEWFEHWDQLLNTKGQYEQVIEPIGRMIFTILDQDGDGSVTFNEYAATFKYSGLEEGDAGPAFKRLDLNRDGKLSVEEILVLADQFFRSNDPAQPGNALFGVLPELAASAR